MSKGTLQGQTTNSESGAGRRSQMKGYTIEQCIEWDLKEVVAQLIETPKETLVSDTLLSEMGLDSLRLSGLSISLSQLYNIELSPSIFFSYPTLGQMREHLLETYQEIMSHFYGKNNPASLSVEAPTDNKGLNNNSALDGNSAEQSLDSDPIAIIGMSGRFPQARNIEDMWKILASGTDVVDEIPADRFDWRKYYSSVIQDEDKTYSKWCGCIPGVDEFDPLFFAISPHEAANMDPKQRLLLQESWKALEDAGYGSHQLKNNKMGMYVGVEQGDYQLLSPNQQPGLTYNHDGVLASRLAYFLDFDGPVMAVNTSCSSSLVAIHLACQSLRNSECDTVIAAGVNLMLSHKPYVAMSQAGMLSADGKCHAFSEKANGMVPSEAIVAVVLKPLSKAKRDGDPIYALISGHGINYDGKTNGITAPSGVSQSALLKSVYQQYHINVGDIQYIVAHGTGTKLGDPIEVNALNDAFKDSTSRTGFCALTSSKTNFGHTLAASGIVSLVNLVKAIQYETIPASLHCPQENNYIDWQNSPFYVNKEKKPWLNNGKPRIGAVSSFGMSGTNAHVVLKGYTHSDEGKAPAIYPYQMLVFSAKTTAALAQKITDMVDFLQSSPGNSEELSQIAYTLMEGRQHFKHRCAIVVQDNQDALQVLQKFNVNAKQPNVFHGEVERGFTGQTALYQFIKDLIQQSLTVKHLPEEYKEKILALAGFYCQGYEISLQELYAEQQLLRVHLPSYPFTRESHWISHDINREDPASMAFDKLSNHVAAGSQERAEILLLQPNWVQSHQQESAAEDYKQRFIILFDTDKLLPQQLSEQLKGVEIINLGSGITKPQMHQALYFENIVLQVFDRIQAILASKPKGQIIVQMLLDYSASPEWLSSLSGLFKTAHLENPKFVGQIIEHEGVDCATELTVLLQKGLQSPRDSHIRYCNGQRYLANWSEVSADTNSVEQNYHPWREDGVYLISGGIGGLGLIFANDIAQHTTNASVILIGRSALTEARQAVIDNLEKQGVRAVYYTLDVTDEQAVSVLIQKVLSEFGTLNGVIHAAGVIQDNFILKKTKDEVNRVLAPKVKGTVYLDQATKALELDFYALFSSISGCLGNAGQADYAVANTFMDAYAHYRNDLVLKQQRRGKTLAINWSQWKEGGMRIDADTEKWLLDTSSMISLESIEGLRAFYQGIKADIGQMMVLKGDKHRLQSDVLAQAKRHCQILAGQTTAVDTEQLKEKTLFNFKVLFGEVTQMSTADIDIEEPLESYGIDSIMITRLNQKLQNIFGNVSKTLFYEYQTLDELTEYFVTEYFKICCQWVGLKQSEFDNKTKLATKEVTKFVSNSDIASQKTQKLPNHLVSQNNPQSTNREPIAIIGMSGRYPDANNLDEYWDNIQSGKNSITDIPAERWSLDGFFNEDLEESIAQGKSYSKWGGFLDGFSNFDPLFFNISPREAFIMDPQERVFIESCWSVFEDAGYTKQKLAQRHGGRVGIFAGITKTGFDLHGPDLWQQGQNGIIPETSFSSVANRVSYFFNLNGPSMPIDTMCSASLTAIHEACEHIYNNECEMAVAGGVNIYLHPSNYVILCKQRMLSVDGLCKSFGQGGNGFVPGEGVGTVLLKPLSKAQADGDKIYAIIRGTSINHGGKTNGYTVPNPTMQAGLIRQTLDKAQIDARTVSYIEAHGTGTELGDPIEFTGLQQAFNQDTSETQFCALGSVKSNIGHLEAAAGIAGISKIVLQMQHKKLAPSLHTEVLNPNIDFGNSPFRVQQQLGEWVRPTIPTNEGLQECSRIAGVSSFGAGGSNAHVILEEYISDDLHRSATAISKQNSPQLIVLSAKNENRLRHIILNFKKYVFDQQKLSTVELPSIAYTLQLGREEMEERVAILVHSIEELEVKLTAYLEGKDNIENLYRGRIGSNNSTLKSFANDEEFQETVVKWIQRKKFSKLLNLWVNGLKVNWSQLYTQADTPQIISLPTYPFEQEKFWLDIEKRPETVGSHRYGAKNLHPLVHENKSTAFEFKFTSTFTGQEFFLEDHQIRGTKILPGVCHLEMARKAAATILSTDGNIVFSDVIWLRPVIITGSAIEESIEVVTTVYPINESEVEYEISYLDTENNIVQCSQGVATLVDELEQPKLALAPLQKLCDQQPLTAEQLYQGYQSIGFSYGPSHQGINTLNVSRDSQNPVNVLAQLKIPKGVASSTEEFYLHPSVLDSALQSSIGLQYAPEVDLFSSSAVLLPFALGSLSIFQPCPDKVWCWIRYSADSGAADAVKKLDISLCDEQGNVCVELKEFSFRAMHEQPDAIKQAQALIMKPIWEVAPSSDKVERPLNEQFSEHHVIMLGDGFESFEQALQHDMPKAHCDIIPLKNSNIVDQYEQSAVAVFSKIKGILTKTLHQPLLVQVLVNSKFTKNGYCLAGISGLLRTASQESPKLITQFIEFKDELTPSILMERITSDANDVASREIRYFKQQREVKRLTDVAVVDTAVGDANTWKDQGVYLITGGLGGLGLIFANDIALNTHGATVILTGRTALGDDGRAKITKLTALGLKVDYQQVDVADSQGVDKLVNDIQNVHGDLNGILYSAGIIMDNYIINKTEAEMRNVLAPKVKGLINLDLSTKDIRLDHFVFFSSTTSALGNPGQVDYAAANGFMDSYVNHRNQLVGTGHRFGQTLSVNWPLWAEGGMQVDDTVKAQLRRLGLHLLNTDVGISAFKQSLTMEDIEQALVWVGDSTSVQNIFRPEIMQPTPEKPPLASEVTGSIDDGIKDLALRYFKQQLSTSLQLSVDRIDVDEPMEQYGIDSIMVMELTNVLEKIFGPLSKTLLFEVQTIRALTEYFLNDHVERVLELLGKSEKTVSVSQPAEQAVSRSQSSTPLIENHTRENRRRRNLGTRLLVEQNNDIAIIGLSGRYPQAGNVNEYWDNLVAGKDCITEVPESRWDHSKYFDPDKNKQGKSYSKWGGFIDGVDQFDTLFFNISPKEAELMDPQERLFLQCVYETIEDAGYTRQALAKSGNNDPDRLPGNVGVFVGVMYEEYQLYGAQAQVKGDAIAISGNPASIANRVSYFCNFHGPSMAIDSMCSSSLSTIHLACQNLNNKTCDIAVAGGVNISIHPNKYLSLSQGKFASSIGKCESFGKGGDGYVPGEGVGAVLLKPLAQALADNDNIYGVIKGTAINHGGKTNGYTVPNPAAQSDVVINALKQSNTDPRTISYIEAHGTGTSLGDPIEITGLTNAYNKILNKNLSTQDNLSYCAIGSAKSNIGHCESAAGIAGVTKVLMQFKHQTLVPSLHSSTLNPQIDFAKTPFKVQQKLEPWQRPTVTVNNQQKEFPRAAGICSFGAGGSNAHVIIEEYIPESDSQAIPLSNNRIFMIVLSAKSQQQLITQAENLRDAVKGKFEDSDLASIAYTLQVGREAFEQRLAFESTDVGSLLNSLDDIIHGCSSPFIHQGQVGKDKNTLSLFAADEDLQETVLTWIQKGKYSKLLELWVKGLNFDWAQLYVNQNLPKRISLPTYPFAKERYWADSLLLNESSTQAVAAMLHPLLHQNTSDFYQQRFTSTFSGEELIFKDHLVNGKKILPGVAVLEMAREAIARAVDIQNTSTVLQLKNIAWSQAVSIASQPVRVHLGLSPEANGDITFELFSDRQTGESVIYSQGSAQFTELSEPEPLDLGSLRAVCNLGNMTAQECYRGFAAMGLNYGPSHQGIEHIYLGDNQLLAKLSLPTSMHDSQSELVLSPGLMDSALQVAIGLLQLDSLPAQPALPFALNLVNVFSACPANVWVWLRVSDNGSATDKSQTLDIDICDGKGKICVQLRGLLSLVYTSDTQISQPQSQVETQLLQPQWVEQFSEPVITAKYQQKMLILCDADKLLLQQISEQLRGVEVINLLSDSITAQTQSETYFKQISLQLFDQVKHILASKPKEDLLVQVLVCNSLMPAWLSGLLGLFKTAHLENPKFNGQLIEYEHTESAAFLAELLKKETQYPENTHVRYRSGKRYVSQWNELSGEVAGSETPSHLWKDKGVYLITGGAGGLGLIFAQEIARHATNASIVLTGRSALTERRQTQLQALEKHGNRAVYYAADVSDKQAVSGLIEKVTAEFGKLNGIVHSAGVIEDNYILKKSKDEMSRVLAPKVNGAVYLDQATQALELDFFALFSSISGCLGSAGQADYSVANTFMDAYAHYRNDLVMNQQRYGKTLSIDWPLWKEGGMQIDAETEKWLRESSGMIPLETNEGVQAFYRALASDAGQVVVLRGDIKKLYSKLVIKQAGQREIAKANPRTQHSEKQAKLDITSALAEKTIDYLKRELTEVTKIPIARIDADAPLDNYGIDSVMVMQLINKMEKSFGSLPKTLFFEYQNIDELSGYLIDNFEVLLCNLFALNPSLELAQNRVPKVVEKPAVALVTANVAMEGRESSMAVDVDSVLPEKTVDYLKRELTEVTKLPMSRIEADAPLDNYGIDSVMVMQLINKLEKTFGSLPKTLFFEYQNLDELSDYLIENFQPLLTSLFKLTAPAQEEVSAEDAVVPTIPQSITAKKVLRSRLSRTADAPPAKEKTASEKHSEDIAIIGLSGRYPQANNINEYWQNLKQGKDCISEVPGGRWDHSLYFSENRADKGKTYSKWGGFLEGVDQFDPLFFNISPREAEIIDPQERLFLQTVYETIEDAGYSAQSLSQGTDNELAANVGVYVGVMYEEYQLYGAQAQALGLENALAIGGTASSVANRVSYYCGFTGPSMAVDTMCSSSLTAIHLACRSLQQGDSQVAIAGGVNVSIHPNKYLLLAQGNFVSGHGRCESFGVGGDGYVPGEGVGAVLLKPLSRAIADGDNIYGIIKGSAINHGGRTNGYTVPNPNAHASVISQAYKSAGVDPRTVSYVEAHGTGTALGDPIEIAGLTKVFKQNTEDKQYCAIGSAKSNIGHCESAAGIAGITKVLLQLKHKKLVPSLHASVLNPNIDFVNSPFVVQKSISDWHRPTLAIDGASNETAREYPRIAGVSSFGAGGSNAHVIIEEYTPTPEKLENQRIKSDRQLAFLLSARTAEQLIQVVEKLKNELLGKEQVSVTDLQSIAYTLQVGRTPLNERLAILATSHQELLEKLSEFLNQGQNIDNLYRGTVKQSKELIEVFTKDHDFKIMLEAWIQQEKYSKVVDLWVKGIAIDWSQFYLKSSQPSRVSLPTYPFAKGRYWLDFATQALGRKPGDLSIIPEAQPLSSRKSPQQHFLEKVWLETSVTAEQSLPGDNVLIVHSTQTRELAELVAGYFENVLLFTEQDITEGGEALYTFIGQCHGWIDLTGCGKSHTHTLNWIPALQKLIDYGRAKQLRLLCVTQGLESFQNRQINLTGASRVGLYRMLQSEYGYLQSSHLDIQESNSSLQEKAKLIAGEFNIKSTAVEVCYRNLVRYVSTLRELNMQTAANYSSIPSIAGIDENQVLLIVGGTRGLGLLCAQHYIKRYGVKRVILTGKQAFPAKEQWSHTDTHSPDMLKKIEEIQKLEELGAKVEVLALPLQDADAVSRELTRVQKALGDIAGIIYAAGCVDTENPAFIRKTIASIASVMEPKVTGLNNILRYFENRTLKFVFLFSSASAIVPTLGSGQSDYAMSNAYLDYVASSAGVDCPVVSIQWPSWKETGMGEVKSQAYKKTGLLSLKDKDGLELLDRIIQEQPGTVIMPVMINDLESFDSKLLMQAKLQVDDQEVNKKRKVESSSSVPLLIADNYAQQFNQWLYELFVRELKMTAEQLDPQTSFQEYGIDSIILAQISKEITKKIAFDFDPSALYEYTTLDQLTNWFNREYQQEIAKAFNHIDGEMSAQESEEITSVEKSDVNSRTDLGSATASITATDTDSSLYTEQSESSSAHNSNDNDIAVVGMSCHFPDAQNIDEFWALLAQGRSSIRAVPDSRWGENNKRYAGLLAGVNEFDYDFFKLSKSDVMAMDPQACLLLTESLKTICHAGYSHTELQGQAVGVYIGARSQHRPDDIKLAGATNPIVAVGQNYLSANISQYYNFQGPSMVIDTACSSAMAAADIALQALNSKAINVALVGGVSLLANDSAHKLFKQRDLLNNTGEFHIFDKRASGIVLGEGAGMVMLKTRRQAELDGDNIYALIKGISVNNDGRTVGPASPNIEAQKKVMKSALIKSGVSAEEVEYIEINGSGSKITDLIEVKAIDSVYGQSFSKTCYLGSMKPNIGHPLCAEGIAGFIKTVLMLNKQFMVPFLSGQDPMDHYSIDSSRFKFCRETQPWGAKLAVLNSFGDGGTNTHVVIQSYQNDPASIKRTPKKLPALQSAQKTVVEKPSEKSVLAAEFKRTNVWTSVLRLNNPIIQGHKLQGNSLLPGLAYIDLLYQWFAERDHNYRELELRNLAIFRPLIVEHEAGINLEISANLTEAGFWSVLIKRVMPDNSDGEATEHPIYATAEMHAVNKVKFSQAVDIATELADCTRSIDMHTVYRRCRNKDLLHTGIMQTGGGAASSETDIWIDISLNEQAQQTAQDYMFHPALIDGSAVGLDGLNQESRLFVPIFYEKFRASQLFNVDCLTRVKQQSMQEKGEVIRMDMEFFNSAGNKIGELIGFTSKLVREEKKITPENEVTRLKNSVEGI